jgi:hypothetical protein
MAASEPGAHADASDGRDLVAVLRRWEDSGAVWRVLARLPSGVIVALYQCDGGEEVERFTSADPGLLTFLTGRFSSED